MPISNPHYILTFHKVKFVFVLHPFCWGTFIRLELQKRLPWLALNEQEAAADTKSVTTTATAQTATAPAAAEWTN